MVNARIFVLIMLLPAATVWAQTERGGIRGTVVDSSQAVIPAVTVTATHVETGVFRSTETTGEGLQHPAPAPHLSREVLIPASDGDSRKVRQRREHSHPQLHARSRRHPRVGVGDG